MSWSANFKMNKGYVVEPTAESNVEPEYHNDQYEEVLQSVWKLIDSGVFGDPKGEFNVHISGHGNPGHVPAVGWANDFVSITITQL